MVEKVNGNPLKVDPQLKSQLEKLEFVKNYRSFKRWKPSFLSRFESFLEQENIATALEAYKEFSKSMETFVKHVNLVESFIEKGELSDESYTVKARNALGEMCKKMTQQIHDLDELIPSTGALEKKRGYNKFHIGAVLVRDGFEEYGRLVLCGDVLKHMREVTLTNADKQILEEMDNYSIKLQKFCDVMADLGLYEVMLKCRQFADGDPFEDFIFLDMKTGGIGEIAREDIMSLKVLTALSKDKDGNDLFQQAATTDEDKEKIQKMLKESPKLGLGFGNANSNYDEEEVNLAEKERVANMWGVKLKKTPKNKKGEELIFVCQKTGQFGELSRKDCIGKELLTLSKDENGKDIIEEAEHIFEERAALVEHVRNLLQLGVVAETAK